MNITKKRIRTKSTVVFNALMLAVATAVLCGCIVTSVYPFYNQKDLVFDQGIVGQWVKADDQNEHWTYVAEGTNSYKLTYRTATQTNPMVAHLFKLQGERFFDLVAAEIRGDDMPPPIPSHMLLRVSQPGPSLRLSAINHEWMKQLVKADPKVIRHYELRTGDKPEDVQVILTADTEELQRFVIRHLTNKETWDDGFELKREETTAAGTPK